jgi:hypothetical protein
MSEPRATGRTEACGICGAVAIEVVVEHQWPGGPEHERREWHCERCGEAYTDDEQGRANAEVERRLP